MTKEIFVNKIVKYLNNNIISNALNINTISLIYIVLSFKEINF